MKLNEGTRVSTDLRTIAGIIAAVAIAVFAYTELTARLVSLETSRELFQADLLKKSEQLPVDQEQLMLLEDLYKTVEKIETRIEDMMHNTPNTPNTCLLYTSPSPRDRTRSRMPSSA